MEKPLVIQLPLFSEPKVPEGVAVEEEEGLVEGKEPATEGLLQLYLPMRLLRL